MVCGTAAKIVASVGCGCTVIGLLCFVVLPSILVGHSTTEMGDHLDGSMITFIASAAGTSMVSVQCTHADRNLPWSIWIPATDNCATRFPAITVTGPAGSVGLVTPENRCSETLETSAVSVGAAAHVPALTKVAQFTAIQVATTVTIDPASASADLSFLDSNVAIGAYTVNCGATPCWVVDEREVTEGQVNAGMNVVAAAMTSLYLMAIGWCTGVTGLILFCISCCVAASTPEDKPARKGRLMEQDNGSGSDSA